jgi:HEAT repeat protein
LSTRGDRGGGGGAPVSSRRRGRALAGLRVGRRRPSGGERLLAVRALPDDRTSVPSLLRATGDPSIDVARAALGRLASLGGPAEAAVLRERLLRVDVALVADHARALRALGDAASSDLCREGLRAADVGVRLSAAIALRELADARGGDALREAVRDPVAGVRRAALEALAGLGPDERNAGAAQALLCDPAADVRRAALRTVVAIAVEPGPRIRPCAADPASAVRVELARHVGSLEPDTVTRLVSDPDWDVREAIAWALVSSPRPDTVPGLIELLADPDRRVRRAACRAAGAAGAEAAVDRLLAALGDESILVRDESLAALRAILGPGLSRRLAAALATPDIPARVATCTCSDASVGRTPPRLWPA